MKCPFCIKVCTTCNKILVANEINFNKKKNGKFGLESKCKKCRKEYQKQWREENKEYYKEWREENEEYFDRVFKITPKTLDTYGDMWYNILTKQMEIIPPRRYV